MEAGLERLRSSAAISAVLRNGTRTHRTTVVVHVLARPDRGPSRATVVAGRRLGGAVARNRAKRRLRAALAELEPPAGTDLVVVARPALLTASFRQVLAELRSALAER